VGHSVSKADDQQLGFMQCSSSASMIGNQLRSVPTLHAICIRPSKRLQASEVRLYLSRLGVSDGIGIVPAFHPSCGNIAVASRPRVLAATRTLVYFSWEQDS
jgi:hypothetical protein